MEEGYINARKVLREQIVDEILQKNLMNLF